VKLKLTYRAPMPGRLFHVRIAHAITGIRLGTAVPSRRSIGAMRVATPLATLHRNTECIVSGLYFQ
jgi:hypothetical protein